MVNNDSAAHTKAVYTDHAFDLAVARRCSAATRRSRPRSWCRAAFRPACRSPTRAATDNARDDASSPRRRYRDGRQRAHRLYKRFQKRSRPDLPLINVAEMELHHRRAGQRPQRRQQSALGGRRTGRTRGSRRTRPGGGDDGASSALIVLRLLGVGGDAASSSRRRLFSCSEARPATRRTPISPESGGDAGFVAALAPAPGAHRIARCAAFGAIYVGSAQGDLGTSVVFGRPVVAVIPNGCRRRCC